MRCLGFENSLACSSWAAFAITIGLGYAKESFNQVNQGNENLELQLKQMGPAYEEFLEPGEGEYLDTGNYGTLLSEWFKIKDRKKFQVLWNNSRRVTDVIDGFIDLREDVRNGVFCPLTVFVYNQCPGYPNCCQGKGEFEERRHQSDGTESYHSA